MYTREDWTLFRSLDSLCQRAGVPKDRLADLVVKELADNAIDAAGACDFGLLDVDDGAGFFVEDEGPGIALSDEDLTRLFSIDRPLISTKLVRLPTRGALGNGLRVVV